MAETVTTGPSTTRPAPDRLQRAHEVLAGGLAGLIVVMAAIAGRSLFGTWDIEVHGYLGNGLFVLAIVNVALAVRRGTGSAAAVAVLALVFAQIGLGYAGRTSLDAAAWHVPNGVLVMGLSAYQYATLRARR